MKLKEFFSSKYLFWFNSKVGKEQWKVLPWRIKFSLIALDLIAWGIIIFACIVIIRRYFFPESLTKYSFWF